MVIGACFVIVFDEYRLTVNGLVFGLLAILLTGAAKSFYTAYVQTVQSPIEEAETRIFFTRLVVGSSMLTAGFCFAFSESTQGMTIPSKQVLIYCLNLITSALATVLGSSLLFRVTGTSDSNLMGFSLVGIVAFLSRQTPIPLYASLLQVGAFAVATISASDNVFKGDLELAQIPYMTLHQLPKQSDSFVTRPIEERAHSPGSMYDQDSNGQTEDHPLFEAHKNRFPAWAKVIKILLLFLAICAWVGFLLDNFVSTRLAGEGVARVRLDLDYKPASQLDIVVSMFEEPTSSAKTMMDELAQIPSIAEREPRFLIYTKDPSADVEALKNETGASMVVKLDNKGREGDTYLHHIFTQWDSLAAQTFFLQGEVHNPREFFPRVEDYYGPDTGMLSLGFSGYSCDCNECGDRFGWYDDSDVISNVYQEGNTRVEEKKHTRDEEKEVTFARKIARLTTTTNTSAASIEQWCAQFGPAGRHALLA